MENSTRYLVVCLISGLFLTHWPMVANRSGLSGPLSVAAFATFCALGLLVAAIFVDKSTLYTASWGYSIGAGLLGSVGLILLGYVVGNATPAEMSKNMIPFLLIQLLPPAAYNIYLSGQFTRDKAIGFAAAVVTIYFLNRSE